MERLVLIWRDRKNMQITRISEGNFASKEEARLAWESSLNFMDMITMLHVVQIASGVSAGLPIELAIVSAKQFPEPLEAEADMLNGTGIDTARKMLRDRGVPVDLMWSMVKILQPQNASLN